MDNVQEIISNLLASGMSQTEIERKTGIPQPRISRWAAGEAPPSADDALKLYRLREEVESTRKRAA